MCTAEGHVLGTRARRQAKAAAAPLHFDHLCYSSLSSPSTMVWSGLMLPSSLSSTLSSLAVPLFSRSPGHFQPGAQSQEHIWIWSYNGDWVRGVWWCNRLEGLVWIVSVLAQPWSVLVLTPYWHFLLLLLLPTLSLSAWGTSHLEHLMCANSPCPSYARCIRGRGGRNESRQLIGKYITLQISAQNRPLVWARGGGATGSFKREREGHEFVGDSWEKIGH